jgi:hypothetical protein
MLSVSRRVSGSDQSRLFCSYSTSHAFVAGFLPVQYILLLTLAYLKVFRVINLILLECKIFSSLQSLADTYRTPIMYYQMRISYGPSLNSNEWETVDHTLQYFARTFGNWSVFAPPVMVLQGGLCPEPRLYDTVSNMLTLEAMQNCESGLYPPKNIIRVLTSIRP